MKLIPNLISTILLFMAIYLTILAHVTDGSRHPYETFLSGFLQRLEKIIEIGDIILPFKVKNNLIENLKITSNTFLDCCLRYDVQSKNGSFKTVSALTKAISYIFDNYIESTSYDYREKLEEIQSTDPIGFIAYLNKKNVHESSPNFMQSIDEFQEAMYKMVPIPNTTFYLSDFFGVVQRIKKSIDTLPFMLKNGLIEDLWQTSNHFKKTCILYENASQKEVGYFSTTASLNKTINIIFADYANRAKQSVHMIREIESVDPVGFNAYMTKKNVNEKSPKFLAAIWEFWKTMKERIRLVKSRTDNSQIDIFEENRRRKVHVIDDCDRERITTEYEPFSAHTVDFFIKLAVEQFPTIKMHSIVNLYNVTNFKPHNSSDRNDVQITYGLMRPMSKLHAICIFYHAKTKQVRVYDSSMYKKLDSKQLKIIARLYPFNNGIVFKQAKTLQGRTRTCGIFAIIYANMLLLGVDPAENEFKLNNVHGDETLYMRLHILNMFANRKLILMK